MSLEERLDRIQEELEKKIEEEENFEPPKRCALCVKINKDKMIMENEIICHYPSKDRYKIGDWKVYYGYNAWYLASELVREYLKKQEKTKCNHEELAEESLELVEDVRAYLTARAGDANPTKLIDVLKNNFDSGPIILLELLHLVGKEWVNSLKPEDYDLGFLELYKKYGVGFYETRYVPPYHKNLWQTRAEWAKTCDCSDCQSYYVEQKESLENTFNKLNIPLECVN